MVTFACSKSTIETLEKTLDFLAGCWFETPIVYKKIRRLLSKQETSKQHPYWQTFTHSKSKLETLVKGVKYVQS